MADKPELAGIDYSELVLIHATPRKPTVNESGNVEIYSAFQNAGGFDQNTDSAQLDGRKPLGVTTRPSVHFTLQDPVSDHAYGAFEGREFTVYSPLKSAIEANGAPETLLTSDTAFFAPSKSVELPGAVVIQVDLNNQLPPNQFAKAIDGGLLVAPQITAANRSHAEILLNQAEKEAPGLGAAEMLGYVKKAEEGATAASEVSKTLALNMLNAPTINKALGQAPESKIGFDGWASNSALSSFLDALPIPDGDKATVVLGRHDGTSADKLNSYFRNSNTQGLIELANDKNRGLAEFARAVAGSDLHQKMRAHEILAELGTESAKVSDDHGVSSNGMGRTFFASNAKSYTSAKLGEVSEQELHKAISDAQPGELLKISDNLQNRGTDHPSDKVQSDFLRTSNNWQSTPPPFLGAVNVIASAGSDAPPPLPAQSEPEPNARPSDLPTDRRVWLAVPHEDREVAREAAGRLESGQSAIGWDKDSSLWFARPGADLARIANWLPDSSIRVTGGDPQAEFLDALTQAGLVVKGMPVMDGQRQRVATVEDKSGSKSGVYRGYLDRRPGGWFINYHRAETEKSVTNWKATGGEADPGARLHIRAAARQSQEDAVRDREQLYSQQTLAAQRLYDRLPGADPAHPYLVRKGITPTPDLRQTKNGALVVPFFNASGSFKTLQYIPPDGEKVLFKNAPKQGNFLVVGGQLSPGKPVLYAEGYATARSLNLAMGQPVVMTIDAGNMVEVAKILHERLPDSLHLFLADFDHAKKENKGLLMATAAAEKIGGHVLHPVFTDEEKARGLTDFNDLHQSRGLDALRNQISPVLAHNNEVPTMKEDKEVPAPDAPPSLVESVLPAAPLSFTYEGEPASLGLPATTSTPTTTPEPLDLAPVPSVAPAPLMFVHNGEPASLGLEPTPVTLSSPVPTAPEVAAKSGPAVDDIAPPQARAEEHLNILLEPALAPTVSTEAPAVVVQPVERQELEAEPTIPVSTLSSLAKPAQVLDQEDHLTQLGPVPASRSAGETGKGTSPAAGSEVDAILVGPPRPSGAEVEPQVSNIDKDALLGRMNHELQKDKTVLYKLDGEPAFVDHGTRLAMADGASQSDEKIVAALLTAAQYYRGRIELTGSDEFKAKAIELIAHHQISVVMKSPEQQAMLEDARTAQAAGPVVRDTIDGDAPPIFGANIAPQAIPTGPNAAPVQAQPIFDMPNAAPVQAQPIFDVPNAAPVQAQPIFDVPSAVPAQRQPAVPKVVADHDVAPKVHQASTKAKDGVIGKLMSSGVGPYRFDPANTDSAYITLRTKTGTETFWGKELAGLMRDTRVQPGKVVKLKWLGQESVVIKVPQKNADGVTTHFKEKDAHRNKWELTVSGGATVRSGQNEGVKLAPYDASRFAVVQQLVFDQLGLDMPVPKAPASGLYWTTPNGQGSAKSGDELSAPRPAVDQTAGQKGVISSWGADGNLDMLLVRGDGPYLQGVVRQGEQFQSVLVSLPGSKDAPPMVFNAVTPEGLVPIGTGNGINRSGNEPVSRENIAFKLEGDRAVRIGKLDTPGEISPALHARLGFDERWKEDNSLPKSAPAAAPAVQPGDPRPA